MISLKTKPLPHQKKAVEKLSKIKIGALYMEQGTGKTRTALDLIQRRLVMQKVNAVLWLCPCSVIQNLKDDIAYHLLENKVPDEIQIFGIESLSSSQRLYFKLLHFVTNQKVYLIVDESNLIKNKDAIRTKRITELASKCSYKLILNGTPVSKNEADMFSQWYLLDWRILGYRSYYSFAANHLEFGTKTLPNGEKVTDYEKIRRVLNVNYLTEKIAPYTYQCKKEECLKLPPKKYHKIPVSLDYDQYEEYGRVKYLYLDSVDELQSATIYKLFTALQHVVSGNRVLSWPDEPMRTSPFFKKYSENPRIYELKKLMENTIKDKKCIIFAKYQTEISDIAKMLADMGLSYVLFTGQINPRQRQENKKDFEDKVQFFLANKSCGAYGLNLQICYNIIYYSNDFDLATRLQSEDRVHRIGQEHEVNIYDIYVEHTIDDFILDCLTKKENLVKRFKKEIDRIKDKNRGPIYARQGLSK